MAAGCPYITCLGPGCNACGKFDDIVAAQGATARVCLGCGERFDAALDRCPSCGWSLPAPGQS